MPAPPLSNTFEGGTDGVAITVGNSGGDSGDAFSSIAGTLCLFEADAAFHGTMGMRIVDATGSNRCQWESLGTITTDVWIRTYLRISTTPVTDNAVFFKGLTQAGTAHMALRINTTTRFMQAENAAGSAIAASIGDVAVPTNDWIRVEARILASATVGQIEWKWWDDPDSAGDPTDTASATGQVLGANTGAALFGISSSAPATPFTADYDDLAVSSTGWIGPETRPGYKRLYGPALLATSAATLFNVPPRCRSIIDHIRLVNNTSSAVDVTMSVGADAAGTRLWDSLTLAADASKSVRGPFTLEDAEVFQAFAGTSNAVTITVLGRQYCL